MRPGRRILAVLTSALTAVALLAPLVVLADGVDGASDFFDVTGYAGGSGWSGSWLESNDAGGSSPTAGAIRNVGPANCYASRCLEFTSIVSANVGIQREADFEGADLVMLTFRYKKSGLGSLAVRVGQNSGSLIEVDSLSNSGAYRTETYDITAYASDTTTIMFYSSLGVLSSAYVDNVVITATYPASTTTTTTTSTTTLLTTTTLPITTTTITLPVTTTTITLPIPTTSTSSTSTTSTTTTTTPPGGSTTSTSTSTSPPDGGTGGTQPPGGGGGGDPGEPPPANPEIPIDPLSPEEVELAGENNIAIDLAAAEDFQSFGIGINPLTGLTVGLLSTVEAISNEIVSSLLLGSAIAFFAVRRIKDGDEGEINPPT